MCGVSVLFYSLLINSGEKTTREMKPAKVSAQSLILFWLAIFCDYLLQFIQSEFHSLIMQ